METNAYPMFWRGYAKCLYATFTSPIMHLICYPLPQILHNLCFSFLLGITAVPREIENNSYAKFWEATTVHHGRCARGVWAM